MKNIIYEITAGGSKIILDFNNFASVTRKGYSKLY